MIRKLLACAILALVVGVIATPADAVKHTGPTKRVIYSYNNSHYTPPKPPVEISRTTPPEPVIIVTLSVGGVCLRLVLVDGLPTWELCP